MARTYPLKTTVVYTTDDALRAVKLFIELVDSNVEFIYTNKPKHRFTVSADNKLVLDDLCKQYGLVFAGYSYHRGFSK